MNATIQTLNKHCTIRQYANRNIDENLLNLLLAAACRASNTGNMQTYSIIKTADAEKKKQLMPAHFNQPMVETAPLILTFCADFQRFTQWCALRNARAGFDNFQSFIGAAIDAMLAAQNFAVAAESVGLGICYLGTTTYNAQEIIETLQLPHLVMPVTTLSVGYPAENEKFTEFADRLPIAAIVHHETYQLPTESDISAFYSEKENSETYRRFVAENAKQTLAQVFTDVRYTKANNEFFSEKYLQALKNQGFL
ncbi:NADPH-dependent oxidoreductase [Bacteroidia bacterium]|nr:NADPH-dependent oxidoreductase [Bacteroidia bacterium]